MRKIKELDTTDRAIIAQLSRVGRLSNTELANRVALTPAPCLRRVKRLEADGSPPGIAPSSSPRPPAKGSR